ncbi:hypothetical protein FA743_19755 [Paracoccus gahaiensis]|uniref:Uncharacterized protein n=2 Tax=Paracoccus gahaiensis TaxID=1706839 RepID=A0A4U0R2G2_9RHOB|nr:hypothetical protein FA743_19755 [Paracoccus gahaiensis]
MSKMTITNFPPLGYQLHLGASHLYPTLLDKTFLTFKKLFDEYDIKKINTQSFRSLTKSTGSGLMLSDKIKNLGINADCMRVIVSAHGLLTRDGGDTFLFKRNAKISKPILDIADLFIDAPVAVHIVIAPQPAYAPISEFASKGGARILADNPDAFSWVDVVNNIKRIFPGKPLILWPIEDQISQSVAFVEGVTGLKFNNSERETIRDLAELERFAEPEKKSIDLGATKILFETYLNDLDFIKDMPDVKLMLNTATSEI